MQEFFDNIITALGPFWPLVQVILIIVGAWVAHWLLQQLIKRFVRQIVEGVNRKRGVDDTQMLAIRSPLESVRTVQRTRTIGQVLSNILTVVVVIIVALWCIGVISPSFLQSLTLLSAAIGAGLGFGAQKVVGDVLNGMFMVIEDQIGVGDDVDMEYAIGTVEAVGIRVTQVRDVYGQLWYVRNGEIQRVGNYSQGWNRAIIDLPVPYSEDRERVQRVIEQVGSDMYEDVDWMMKLLEKPSVWGLQTLSAESVIMRLAVKTSPGERWGVERELRARIQDALKAEDITLPPMNLVRFDGPNGIEPRPAEED